MRVNNINGPKMDDGQYIQANKEQDYSKMENQHMELKISDQEDSLEMFDKDRNIFKDMNKSYSDEQIRIANIQAAEFLIYRTDSILDSMASLALTAGRMDLRLDDRQDLQFRLDDFTRDIKNISANIEKRLGMDDYGPGKLGIEGVMSLAKMGKITVKSRRGRSERISVSYSGKQNRTVIIDSDKNTGNLMLSLKEDRKNNKRYEMTNLDFKHILEENGFYVDIEENGELDPVEEGDYYLKDSGDYVGLNISDPEAADESLDKIYRAMDRLYNSRKDLARIRYGLSLDFIRLIRERPSLGLITSKEEAYQRLEEVKEYIFEQRELREYVNRIQNPELVYYLLR